MLRGFDPVPQERSQPDVDQLRREQAEGVVDLTFNGQSDSERQVGVHVPAGKQDGEENNQNNILLVPLELLQPGGMLRQLRAI